jgi:hypothetical protein
MEPIAAEIEQLHTLFAAGSNALDQTALNTLATVAARYRNLVQAAAKNRYDLTMRIVGRAAPDGRERQSSR